MQKVVGCMGVINFGNQRGWTNTGVVDEEEKKGRG